MAHIVNGNGKSAPAVPKVSALTLRQPEGAA
jgi:hypothetical protein